MPLAVTRGSNEFEDFWYHRGVTVRQCHKICQKKVKIWSKSCQKVVNNNETSETGRRKRRRRRRFAVPKPGTTLSHLVKIDLDIRCAVVGLNKSF
jgi:hypothetical protein